MLPGSLRDKDLKCKKICDTAISDLSQPQLESFPAKKRQLKDVANVVIVADVFVVNVVIVAVGFVVVFAVVTVSLAYKYLKLRLARGLVNITSESYLTIAYLAVDQILPVMWTEANAPMNFQVEIFFHKGGTL